MAQPRTARLAFLAPIFPGFQLKVNLGHSISAYNRRPRFPSSSLTQTQAQAQTRFRTGLQSRFRTTGTIMMDTSTNIKSIYNHKSIATYHLNGITITEHQFQAPLDHFHAIESSQTITIFAREVYVTDFTRDHGLSQQEAEQEFKDNEVVCYFQGGPGFEAPQPAESSGFIKELLKKYKRVILLDQRGTGKSTPISTQSLQRHNKDPIAQKDFLLHFRADSIIRDAELLRNILLGDATKWAILGQSFGGFCCFAYLSTYQDSISQVLVTGGIPPSIDSNAKQLTSDAVYTNLIARNTRQMDAFYKVFPNDQEIIRNIVLYLHANQVVTPCGNRLTVDLFLSIGLRLLGFGGSFARCHYILERAFELAPDHDNPALSYYFLRAIDNLLSFDTNPIYALLHEACYSTEKMANQWSAYRILHSPKYKDTFDAVARAKQGLPIYFTGEQVYPNVFQDMVELRPLQAVANLLAEYADWKPLYDLTVLSNNQVPIAAAVYINDMYVDFDLSMKTSAQVKNLRMYVSNMYTHGGLREDAANILRILHELIESKTYTLEAL